MKTKFSLIAALIVFAATIMTGCNSGKTADDSAEGDAITVDSILANPDNYVGQTVTIEGVVSHLCKHGGRKAFVLGETDSCMIRCDATEEMGGVFPQECVHNPIKVTGVVVESRLDEQAIRQLEEERRGQIERVAEQNGDAEAMANAPTGCETERKVAGQGELDTFAAQMADYRRRIAERDSLEGKPYLSSYYIEAASYELLKK